MLYLSGVRNKVIDDLLADGRIGFLKGPVAGNRLSGVKVWAADNGAFTNTYPGDDKYLTWLNRYVEHQDRCLFVAVPDVLGDAAATLDRFPVMADRIAAEGWPVALVAQDGMRPDDVSWSDLDYLFIGGSTEYKLGPEAHTMIRVAQEHGVPVHIGRVNSARRYRHFAELGCDSADGTYVRFHPVLRSAEIRQWIRTPVQETLPF